MRPHAALEHSRPVPQGLLPEGGGEARPVLAFVAAPDVVDKQVEATLFPSDAGEQRFDLGVGRVVAADGDSLPTSLRDRRRRLVDRAGEALRRSAVITAARDVDD